MKRLLPIALLLRFTAPALAADGGSDGGVSDATLSDALGENAGDVAISDGGFEFIDHDAASPDAGPALAPEDEGCQCHAAATPTGAPALTPLFALLVLLARRRQRRG